MPSVYAVGTFANSTTGAAVPGAPGSDQADDIWILLVESANQTPNSIAGWTNIGTGTVQQATGLVTALTARWHRYAPGDTAPSVTTPATQDHVAARIIGVRGCITSGSPVATSATGTDNTTGTGFTIPGANTGSIVDCLIIAALSTGTDVNSSAMASGWTNASLTSLTEQVDNWTVSGNGGGIAAASGTLAAGGAYSATTGTLVTGNTKALMSFALRGPGPVGDQFSYVAGMRGSGPFY